MDLLLAKQKVTQALANFLKQEHFNHVRIYSEDANNEFLIMMTNPLNYKIIYNNTVIYNSGFYSEFDYRKDDDFNKADGLIIFQQVGFYKENNIKYAIGKFNNKKCFYVIFYTQSEIGKYESNLLDMCFGPFN